MVKTIRLRGNGWSFLKNSIMAALLVLVAFVVLLFVSGEMKYLSFMTGLYVGMTLIQVYFHRFSDPLPPEKSPEPPVSPIKMMSYGIQAFPKKPWREILFMAVLFIWGIYQLITVGFR
jgi:multisubunit Na+/H+ antiporter MnhE subunit